MRATLSRLHLLALPVMIAATGAAEAAQVRVTVENLSPTGGVSVTPLYAFFHSGFDAFDAGSTASPGVEEIAELGSPATVRAERLATEPGSEGGVIASPSGPPPIEPGETAERVFTLDPMQHRYFSYLSMVVPTNDLFIGNDDPLAHMLFDAGGAFAGPLSFTVFGRAVWDAGTEVNDLLDGGAFVAGVDATLGSPEGEVVSLFLPKPGSAAYLNSLLGVVAANGQTITGAFGADDALVRISVDAVPAPVPVPAALPLLVSALAAMGLAARRRTA